MESPEWVNRVIPPTITIAAIKKHPTPNQILTGLSSLFMPAKLFTNIEKQEERNQSRIPSNRLFLDSDEPHALNKVEHDKLEII